MIGSLRSAPREPAKLMAIVEIGAAPLLDNSAEAVEARQDEIFLVGSSFSQSGMSGLTKNRPWQGPADGAPVYQGPRARSQRTVRKT
jgi:hypothetical protein